MSNALAIATVTATLQRLLLRGTTADRNLEDTTVTTATLDKARTNGNTANQLNLFLYHAAPSAAWRNMDVTSRSKPGETAAPALGLNLYYLITAFGRDGDANRPFSHHLLGRAVSILHDHPILGSDEIKTALPDNDLYLQIERVRLTLQPLSLEEMSKLWTGFQTQYRLSVAYEAAVVLIDSNQAIKAALPVLTRGQSGQGVASQTDLVPAFPTLARIELPGSPSDVSGAQPNDDFPRHNESALPGDEITFRGHHLSADDIEVSFAVASLLQPLLLSATAKDDSSFTVAIPDKPAEWAAGLYTVTATVKRKNEQDRTTNALALSIAPQITSKLPATTARVSSGVTLKLTCAPDVRPDQRVSLLLGSQEIVAEPRAKQTKQLTFLIPAAEPGEFWIRLRVDGVDSPLVDRTGTAPKFDPRQMVTIT